MHGLRQVPTSHSGDIEVFDDDDIMGINDTTSCLMGVIESGIGDVSA